MKEALQNALAKGDTEQVITKIVEISKDNPTLQKEILQISTRWNDYAYNKRHGLLQTSELDLERNKINVALLQVIDNIEPNINNSIGSISNWQTIAKIGL